VNPGSFDGLHASSFDAFSPEKWSSNVYTRERLEVKGRLMSLARALESAFERKGLTLQRYASDEYPSLRNGKKVDGQWIFFWRTEQERLVLEREVDLERTLAATIADPTPMTRHAFLCLRIDVAGLELSFRLHRDAWVDQHNLLNKISDAARLDELVGLVRRLPEPAHANLTCAPVTPAAQHTPETLRAMVTSHAAGEAADGFLCFGLRLERARAIALGADVPTSLAPTLTALADLYRFVAWSEANDFVGTDREFMARRAERGARRQELAESEELHRAAQEAKKREREAARKELEEVFRREAAARAAAPPKRPRPATDEQPPAPKPADAAHARPEPKRPPRERENVSRDAPTRRTAQPRREPETPQPVREGHLARVSKGPFAGQVGVVQEVDAKGTARVMVGLLATRMPIDDLIGLGPPPSSSDGSGRGGSSS
jgi:transcription antitermination factor NusG